MMAATMSRRLPTLVGCLWLALAGAAVAQQSTGAGEAPPADQVEEGQDDTADAPATAEERIQELEQKVRILERKGELAGEQAAEKARTATSATASRDGFSFKSADNNFQIRLRGLIHADARYFGDDEERPAVDTFLLRRVRPIVEGMVFKIFDFRFTPDFGEGRTVLQDAYLDARFTPAARVRAGKFKTPFGIERLQSASDLVFVERGLPNNLVPNRDVGIQLHGDVAGGRLSYAVGLFNGVPDGGSADADTNSDKEVAARLFAQPFSKGDSPALRNLGFGIAATTGDQSGTAAAPGLPTYRTGGQASFFTYRSDGTAAGTTIAAGERTRWSPQLTWYAGRLGLLAEYVVSSQELQRGADSLEAEHGAWQAVASWALFGGEPSYRGINPKKPFDLEAGTWGALEIAARYNVLDVDDDVFPVFASPTGAASRAEAWAVGLNWYLNRGLRWMLDYEQTTFEGGAAGGDREDEKVLLNRFQIAF